LVRFFNFINHLIHFIPFPVFNVLKGNDDKLPLLLSAHAVVYDSVTMEGLESLDPVIHG